MIIVRFLLISLIVYLIVRSFIKEGQGSESDRSPVKPEDKVKPDTRKISKSVGEYVDYEELKGNDK
jgi:hypothetical protein